MRARAPREQELYLNMEHAMTALLSMSEALTKVIYRPPTPHHVPPISQHLDKDESGIGGKGSDFFGRVGCGAGTVGIVRTGGFFSCKVSTYSNSNVCTAHPCSLRSAHPG